MYRVIVLSRKVDDREIQLKRQNKIYFQINGVGHEAVGAAMGQVFRPGYDWFFFYYRDRAASLALGITPLEMMLQAVGAKDEPQSGARQMPSHFSSKPLHIANTSSPTGTQFLQACGTAEAGLLRGGSRRTSWASRSRATRSWSSTTETARRAKASSGESMNTACNRKLPVVYDVEDNGYSISVPVEDQHPRAEASESLLGTFPNLLNRRGGRLRSHRGSSRRTGPPPRYARARQGPCARPRARRSVRTGHSLSDDESNYKTRRRSGTPMDGATRSSIFAATLVREGIGRAGDVLDAIDAQLDEEIARAVDEALAAARPEPDRRSSSSTRPRRPDGSAFATAAAPKGSRRRWSTS
jgi:2-oxoisovalerate dehydrogenase E1 component